MRKKIGEFVEMLRLNMSGKPKDFDVFIRLEDGTEKEIDCIHVVQRQVIINVK